MRRRRGYWIEREHLFSGREYVCSVCGRHEYSPSHYCPSCGAEMSGIDYDPAFVEEAAILDMIMDDDDEF